MKYYLRVEAVNLSNFVYDTSNLATIRGGGVLLLGAMDYVEKFMEKTLNDAIPNAEEITAKEKVFLEEINAIKHDKSISKKEKKAKIAIVKGKKKQAQSAVKQGPFTTITKGASWGLFQINVPPHRASGLTAKIEDAFNADSKYKHATFVVNLYEAGDDEPYTVSRAKAQTLNKWQQLQKPSLSICREGKGVCSYDKVKPADRRDTKGADKTAAQNEYLSESVYCRREKGRDIKNNAQEFYKKNTKNDRLDTLALTADFNELSTLEPGDTLGNLSGKIAFIYIDGNEFGKKQQACDTSDKQQIFDEIAREGRNKLLSEILTEIIANKDSADKHWFNKQNLRLETLLWGGDEIIWVVPAWQGWWMLKEFYRLAAKHITLPNETLYHGASLIFCKHKAPIQTIDTLARSLADMFAKKKPFKGRNMFAYQVLESFDHAGADLYGHRKMLVDGLSDSVDDLLIEAGKMDEIEACILELKKLDFPKRKMYQIVSCYKRGDGDEATNLRAKLVGQNANDTAEKEVQKGAIQTQLDQLKTLFGVGREENQENKETNEIFWLHLIELWDYIGLEEITMQPKGE